MPTISAPTPSSSCSPPPKSATSASPTTFSATADSASSPMRRRRWGLIKIKMGISKEAEISIAASSMFPGFRFSPTDEELLLFYLKKKVDGFSQCVEVINEVDICKHEPWDLPGKSTIKSDQEWFFFSPRGKKYPNGSQSKRATEIGYWKATGKERGVKSGSEIVGTKRTLVFHIGRAPKGERTEWIMHEYCLLGNPQESLVICRLRKKNVSNANASESYDIGTSNLLVDGACSASGRDPNRISAERAIQWCSKKCSSSNESHSVEQNDHASESDHKVKDEGMEPESSSQPELAKGNTEDDCFTEILKDNIIELDETALPTRTTTTALSMQKPEAMYGQGAHPFIPQIDLSQGTASRRIRLKKARNELHKGQKEDSDDNDDREGDSSSSGKTTKVSTRYRRKTSQLYVVMILVGMLAMLFNILGSPWQSSFCLCPAGTSP